MKMKKKHLVILSCLLLIGFVAGICQYVLTFKAENVSAVTVGTPDPGHAWSQMECSADSLCVDTVNNRLGIGTNTPGEKLTVSGNLSITGIMTGGTVPWARLGSFPSACSSGQYVTGVGSTLSCATPASGGITGSGTASYVSKWSSGSALTNSIIYDNGTNVGIGKSPSYKLDVNGSINATSLCMSGYCATGWPSFTTTASDALLKSLSSLVIPCDYATHAFYTIPTGVNGTLRVKYSCSCSGNDTCHLYFYKNGVVNTSWLTYGNNCGATYSDLTSLTGGDVITFMCADSTYSTLSVTNFTLNGVLAPALPEM